ncbi:acyl-CoA desaturase [Plastoroseomonas arctica]|uniref:Acyl-CoA desaturase n=1 Tax=Plastoroseomonas arctica TaxID=1509237 RepID=A0AAF1KR48_9PROT|nr:acyl-CoA desaturase [Plastoroseomonas arctica]MBR0653892.1 acyl-CoA desaturase [Plastoroseomonas arctica]
MTCLSTDRMIASATTSATDGTIRWSPARSIFTGGMTAAALLAPAFATPGAIILFLATTAVTICAGHSVGMHRLLIHRSFAAPLWVERLLVYLGTLVGMAGPIGMVRLHDTRDWAQRQVACHDLHAHRAGPLRDAWWQMHCRLDLAHPPRFAPESRLSEDRFYLWLERSWMAQQLPWAILFFAIGGMPWLIWGVPLRVAISLNGHWLVGHVTHRRGPQGWVVDGAAVQGHNLPAAALVTFGEAWHGNHHAWPGSARLGLEPGQADPGWWFILALRRLGLAWDIRQPGDLPRREGLRRVGTLRPTTVSVPRAGAQGAQR